MRRRARMEGRCHMASLHALIKDVWWELIDSLVSFQFKNSTSVPTVYLPPPGKLTSVCEVEGGSHSSTDSYIWLCFSLLVSMTYRLRSTLDRASIITIIRLPSHTLYSWEDGHPPRVLDVIYKMASNHALNTVDLLHHSAIHVATSEPLSTHHCDLYEPVGRHIRQCSRWILTIGPQGRHGSNGHFQVILTHYLWGWFVNKITQKVLIGFQLNVQEMSNFSEVPGSKRDFDPWSCFQLFLL